MGELSCLPQEDNGFFNFPDSLLSLAEVDYPFFVVFGFMANSDGR
ncbi:hypothetical protein [Bacillus sp. 1P06AnD]